MTKSRGRSIRRRLLSDDERVLKRGEWFELAIPILIGLAIPILQPPPVELWIAAVVSAFVVGIGIAYLSGLLRFYAASIVLIGTAFAWFVSVNAGLALAWGFLFPCGVVIGGHLRGVRTSATSSDR